MRVLTLDQIQQTLELDRSSQLDQIITQQEDGFVAYSRGEVVVPDVFHLPFDDRLPGDLHIKGARLKGGDRFVIKLASGFPENRRRFGISTSQGLMIVGCADTGRPLVLLQDQGFLTDLRTALAGHIAAKYLAPSLVTGIGVLGSGIQARLQSRYLRNLTSCRELILWGRTPSHVASCARDLEADGFTVDLADSPAEVADRANLIVTTTATTTPLLHARDIRSGSHITAMGADAPGKQELAPAIFERAARCIVDSKSQCLHHGESRAAVANESIGPNELIELGEVISNPQLRRPSDDAITIADLTGVGVQDLQIAIAASAALSDDQRPTDPN